MSGGIESLGGDFQTALPTWNDLPRSPEETNAGEASAPASSRLRATIEASGIVDREWYLEEYPDVREAGVDAVEHFSNYGVYERRQPNALFSGRWYAEVLAPDELAAPVPAYPSLQAEIEASGIVDRDWYLDEYPDVRNAGVDPIKHFAEFGVQEGRRPNALFSLRWYAARHPEVQLSWMHPVLHYIRHGARNGFDPHPLFDSSFYLAQNPAGLARQDALKHYLQSKAAARPFPGIPTSLEGVPPQARHRIQTSPILSRLPPAQYLAQFVRPEEDFSDRLHTIEDLVRASQQNPYRIGAELHRDGLCVIALMEREKRRLATRYRTHPQDELVSVVMPTFNRPATISDAINSIMVQSYGNWELIVIDDAGEESAEAVVRSYGDSRIRYFRCDTRRGMAAARNIGIDRAGGTAIAYLDDDDQWDPDFLLLSLNGMREAGRRMLYSAQMLWRGFDDVTLIGKHFQGVLFGSFNRSRLEENNFISMISVIHDRSLFDECGRFDEQVTRFVDWDLFLRLTEAETPVCLPCVLSHYFQTRTANSMSANDAAAENIELIRRKMAERALSRQVHPSE